MNLAARLTGLDSTKLSEFFAQGMLLNVLAMMGQFDEPQAWAMRLIEGCGMNAKLGDVTPANFFVPRSK